MYSLKFIIRKDKPNQSGYAPIYLRYTFLRKSTNIPLKKTILIQNWDEENARPKNSYKSKIPLLDSMDSLEQKVRTHLKNYHEAAGRYPFPSELKALAEKTKFDTVDEEIGVEKAFRQYIQSNRHFVTPATISIYETTWLRLKEFFEWAGLPLSWTSFDSNFPNKYRQYFYSKNYSRNTLGKYTKQTKAFLKYCERQFKTIKSEQYQSLKIEAEVPTIVSLNLSELEKIKSVVIGSEYWSASLTTKKAYSPREHLIGRIFVFLCRTGLRFSDFSNLTFHNLFFETDIDGSLKLYISINIKKTKKIIPVTIPVLNDALDILFYQSNIPPIYGNVIWWRPNDVQYKIASLQQRLKEFESGVYGNGKNNIIQIFPHYPRIFPKISDQAFNREIKDFGEKIGLNTPVLYSRTVAGKVVSATTPMYSLLKSHIGRKTFVTLSLESGVRTEFIQQATGHTDSKAMKPYLKITSKAVFNGFMEKMKPKELTDETPKKRAKAKAEQLVQKNINTKKKSPFNPNGIL